MPPKALSGARRFAVAQRTAPRGVPSRRRLQVSSLRGKPQNLLGSFSILCLLNREFAKTITMATPDQKAARTASIVRHLDTGKFLLLGRTLYRARGKGAAARARSCRQA